MPLEDLYADDTQINLVQDKLTAHRKAALYEVFDAQRVRNILRFTSFVYTPKYGSWLDMAEIELSILNRVALNKRIESKAQLQKQIKIGSSQQKTQEPNSKSYAPKSNLE